MCPIWSLLAWRSWRRGHLKWDNLRDSFGSMFGFSWLVLSWKQRQNVEKLSVILDQLLESCANCHRYWGLASQVVATDFGSGFYCHVWSGHCLYTQSPTFLSEQFYLVTYRAREWVGQRRRERKSENSKQTPHCQHRAPWGAQTHKPRDRDLSRDQESHT